MSPAQCLRLELSGLRRAASQPRPPTRPRTTKHRCTARPHRQAGHPQRHLPARWAGAGQVGLAACASAAGAATRPPPGRPPPLSRTNLTLRAALQALPGSAVDPSVARQPPALAQPAPRASPTPPSSWQPARCGLAGCLPWSSLTACRHQGRVYGRTDCPQHAAPRAHLAAPLLPGAW